MFAEFYITLVRDGYDEDALVEYHAARAFGDIDIEITSVKIDGKEIETSQAEDRMILDAIFDRVDEDWQAYADGYADYRYDMSSED